MNACLNSGINYLQNFVIYFNNIQNNITQENVQVVNNQVYKSDWEDLFHTKLIENNINAFRQRSVDNYFLDFAIELNNGKKLNIEIDGEYYHRNWNGELALRDRLRNKRLIELGWDVMRFWVYQVRDDLDFCINRVRDWIEKNK